MAKEDQKNKDVEMKSVEQKTEKKDKETSPQDEEDSNNKLAGAASSKRSLPNKVVVHPLVLLSVVDHYNRVATKKRVVGILLGERRKGQVDVTNSYAVPFEEDLKDPSIWYLDHNYHENMVAMFNKVNAKEKVVGWYSTGTKVHPADLEIDDLISKYTTQPVLTIIDVNPKDDLEIPTKAYVSVESRPEEQSTSRRTFLQIVSEVGAYEAEEVGVEHLLRDIRDTTVGSVSDRVTEKVNALKGLRKRMEEMQAYLRDVASGKVPPNHQILYNMQDIFNLSPNLKVEELVHAFSVKTNDNMMVLYVSSLIRSIIALHDLINNKAMNKEEERKLKEKEEKEKVDREKKEQGNGSKSSTDAAATTSTETEAPQSKDKK